MFRELTFDDLKECSQCINERVLNNQDSYFMSPSMVQSLQIVANNMRAFRNLVFEGTIGVYGKYEKKKLRDIVIVTYIRTNDYCIGELNVFPLNDADFVNYAISASSEEISDIQKFKVISSTVLMDRVGNNVWNEMGFKHELCLREFNDSQRNIHYLGRIINR